MKEPVVLERSQAGDTLRRNRYICKLSTPKAPTSHCVFTHTAFIYVHQWPFLNQQESCAPDTNSHLSKDRSGKTLGARGPLYSSEITTARVI